MITLLRTRQEFIKFRESINTDSIGLVPTMGNLHQGHLNLVQNSIDNNKVTIVTIFVNPKQFGPTEDYADYPRTLESDIEKLSTLAVGKEIIVFAPNCIEDIYPEGFNSNIQVFGLDKNLCASFRPGHFDGVTTVVYQLFLITKPSRAYFGQKDYQQYRIIKKMVHDLLIPVELFMVPIARDLDGLALSSRNQYLSKDERKEALILPETLLKLRDVIQSNNESLFSSTITDQINTLKKDSRWQYLEILDAENLSTPNSSSKKILIAGAFILSKARLIDNQLLELNLC